MRNLRQFWRLLSGEEFGDEIAAHLALETDRLIAEGWAPNAARDEARRRFGNVGRVREHHYDRTHFVLIDDLTRDVRYALRSLAKDKAYVLAAVAALGTGLAANIALFSLFSAIAFRPLPVRDPERLVSISQVKPPIRFGPFSLADYFFYRENARSLQNIAVVQPAHLRLAGLASSALGVPQGSPGAVAEPVIALFVTSNVFETFGIRPPAGRLLQPDDDANKGVFAAVVSDNYWQRRFGREPSIIGTTLIVSGIRVTVVGVSPHDFAGVRQEVPDLWISLSALGDVHQRAARETTACCEMVGRLADGYTLTQAQSELANLAAVRRQELPPSERQMTVTVSPAVSFGSLGEQVRPLFAALQVAMLLVLLIACANVASLMLGRAAARDREIAIRLATGAGRGRLIRQLLTEGIVVALFSGVFAAAATLYALEWGARLMSAYLSRTGGGAISLALSADTRFAVYVASISILAGVVFALAPALQATRADLASLLRTAAGATPANGAGRLRSFLISAQITISVSLLIVAAGLARSASQLAQADPGFDSHDVVSVWLTNPQELALPAERARQIEDEVRRRFATMTEVQSVAVASRVPLGGNVSTSAMLPSERVRGGIADDGAPRYPYSFVSEAYFSTLGIRLLRGRTFTAAEVRGSAPVAIISDSIARVAWPHADAIGKQVALSVARPSTFGSNLPLNGSAEVIGVVSNVRGLSMSSFDIGDVYLPKLTNDWSSRILLRVSGDPQRVMRAIPQIVREVEPALPVSVQPYDDIVASESSVMTARVSAVILAIVGGLGLLLASVGVYGMIAYAIRQKQREIGIRMALGAHGVLVLRAALRGSMQWLTRGIVVGVILGVVGVKLTNAVLAGVSVSASILDPVTMVVVPVVIGAVALAAAAVSARKAALTNPAVVLRDG